MYSMYWQELHTVVGLAVDIREEILFYSDVARNHENIGRVNLHNSSAQIIVTGMERSIGRWSQGGGES